jgi:anti-anti-sigma factor
MTAAQLPLAFRCDVQPDRERVVVRLAGDLDLVEAPAVARTLEELIEGGFHRVVIDLRQLSFIDSTGLRVLLTARDAARGRGTELALIRGPRHVERLLSLTRTADLFRYVDR